MHERSLTSISNRSAHYFVADFTTQQLNSSRVCVVACTYGRSGHNLVADRQSNPRRCVDWHHTHWKASVLSRNLELLLMSL
jgi:hypothetical protein